MAAAQLLENGPRNGPGRLRDSAGRSVRGTETGARPGTDQRPTRNAGDPSVAGKEEKADEEMAENRKALEEGEGRR